MSAGIVYLVGAGPGDPELLTVKARRLLEQADVIVHDRLVSRAVLDLIPTGTHRIDAGKTGGGDSTPQAEILEVLLRLGRAGFVVVRLKGGDPFVFGRGGEEALALAAAGIAVEIVPGVTSGIAGPGLAGIPLTHRGLARSVAFVTGHEDPASDGPEIDWPGLATVHTIVVFMAGRTARSVARRLLAAGRRPDVPVAVVVDGSLPSQEVHVTDLSSVARGGTHQAAGRPVLLVVGEVAGLADALAGALVPRPTSAAVGAGR